MQTLYGFVAEGFIIALPDRRIHHPAA